MHAKHAPYEIRLQLDLGFLKEKRVCNPIMLNGQKSIMIFLA